MTKTVLILSPTPSHPQNSGSRSRIFALLTSIQNMGHDLHFLHFGAEPDGDSNMMQECWGDRFHYVPYLPHQAGTGLIRRLKRLMRRGASSIDDWYDPSLDKALVNLTKIIRFDVVIVEYVFFSKALSHFGPNTLKVIDTIDVFSNRHERMIQQGLHPNWYSATPAEEGRGLNRADLVITISAEDENYLSNLVPNKAVTIGHIVPIYEPISESPRTGKMLFVGSANPMNVQALRFFIEQVFPSVKFHYLSAQLLVVGSVGALLGAYDDCVRLGNVDDLRSVYTSVDVVINPMRFGTGLSIKSLEALGHTRPLVTTSIGARGLADGAGKAFLVADTPEEFVSAIASVLSDEGCAEALSRNAYDFIVAWNKRNMAALENLLNA